MYFWRLILNMKVTCIPTACFAFSNFLLSVFLSILKWWHRHDGHLCAYWLLHIFTICRKCLLFQFLGYGIGMQILIETEVQKKCIAGWKNGHNLLKNILFQLNFQDEGQLLVLYSLLRYMPSFSVLRLWHRYAHSHFKRSSKWINQSLKK